MCWLEIPEHFANATLDAFIIMPDHLHGIVLITDATDRNSVRATDTLDRNSVGAQHAAPLQRTGGSRLPLGSIGPVPGSLGAIVRGFKSAATKRINEMRHMPGKPVWQRNYYDRIIRDDRELQRARQYVLLNPARRKDAAEH